MTRLEGRHYTVRQASDDGEVWVEEFWDGYERGEYFQERSSYTISPRQDVVSYAYEVFKILNLYDADFETFKEEVRSALDKEEVE